MRLRSTVSGVCAGPSPSPRPPTPTRSSWEGEGAGIFHPGAAGPRFVQCRAVPDGGHDLGAGPGQGLPYPWESRGLGSGRHRRGGTTQGSGLFGRTESCPGPLGRGAPRTSPHLGGPGEIRPHWATGVPSLPPPPERQPGSPGTPLPVTGSLSFPFSTSGCNETCFLPRPRDPLTDPSLPHSLWDEPAP